MKRSCRIILILISLFSSYNCNSQSPENHSCYFNQIPPEDSAVVFADTIFNFPQGYHSALIFTKDCKEVYFTPMTTKGEIYQMNISKPHENEKLIFNKGPEILDPSLSFDNEKLYFLSFEPLPNDSVRRERIWYSKRENDSWGEPKVINKTVYSHPTHWQFTLTKNDDLYFTSEINGDENQDIYVSRYINHNYENPVRLPDNINTDDKEFCPYIDSDEEFILFSRIAHNTKKADIFISKKQEHGWTNPKRLSDKINSEGHDLCPMISPCREYLFFISTRSGISKIYWVNTNFLND